MRKRIILITCLGFILFYLVASGCSWITFTANDRLDGEVRIKSVTALTNIYTDYIDPGRKDQKHFEEFKRHLDEMLQKKGYLLADSKPNADLVLSIKPRFYIKKEGVLYFLFFVIPMDGLSSLLSVDMSVVYKTRDSSFIKMYRAHSSISVYSRSERKDEYWYRIVANKIIEDLNSLRKISGGDNAKENLH